jgi:hypothetical protein
MNTFDYAYIDTFTESEAFEHIEMDPWEEFSVNAEYERSKGLDYA